MERNIYLLKDLAHVTGHSVDTLKFYLKIGLIREVAKGIETNFRFFDDSTVGELKIVRDFRKNGISLQRIKDKLVRIRKGYNELL
ncbi:MAG: MerR family transcriptional regulator [Dehalococcoidia bacterium]|nr:MAG: MerR family transcriptional regulator [Dehalococcoidia bacterium]